MALGFGGKSSGPDARMAGDKQLSPEQQMNKLREQARSGGGGAGGRWGEAGRPDAPVAPIAEDFPAMPREIAREESIVLDLTPDTNDKDMEELLQVLRTKGFKAVLKHLDRINNPHIEDDFHRFLVQYRKDGHSIPGLKKNDPYAKALDTILYEIAIPIMEPGHGEMGLTEIVAAMEQFYLGMTPFFGMPDPVFFKDYANQKAIMNEHFTLELAVSGEHEEAIFYASIPRRRQDTFEKLILSLFPRAHIKEEKADYNPFNQFGKMAGARMYLRRPGVIPIKTADQFHADPLNLTLSAFSHLTKEGEGAAIQLMFAPAGEYWRRRVMRALAIAKEGKSLSNVGHLSKLKKKDPWWRTAPQDFGSSVKGALKDKKEEKEKEGDPALIEAISKKLRSPIVGVNVRIIASARTQERADMLLQDIESTFSQFDDSEGNRFFPKKMKTKADKRDFARKFIWRTFDRALRDTNLPEWWDLFYQPFMDYTTVSLMNVTELATVFHFTIAGGTTSREIKHTHSRQAPAPPHIPHHGLHLGRNVYANHASDIYLTPEDRLRHLYTIGQTGTGKTTFLKDLIVQDIENGEGLCFIDPHGVDVVDILSRVPKERYDDLIYFDPAYLPRPMGLNMLEYDPRFPEQKTFVVDEMFKIFKKLYGDVPEAFGPIFEQYFRNAAGLVVEDPETGSTLMDISRVLADEDFRHLKLSRSRNPVINHFWEEIAEQVRGEGDLRNVVPYITSKFDIFIANEIMRPVVGQQRSAFDFKDVMDKKKILLVNLSKGRLGDINANLIGLVLVGKIMMAALARAEYLHTNPPPFYLYLDEFQNITTDSIATILSEARKYRLSLTIAHQFIGQLSGDRMRDAIQKAVFGNVGTMVTFRVGTEDATFLEKQYAPTFTAHDMMNLDNYNTFVKLLAEGKPVSPTFSMETLPFRSGDAAQIDVLKQLSYQRFGRPREAVEEEIRQKYQGMKGK